MTASFKNQFLSNLCSTFIRFRLFRFLPWFVLAVFLLATWQLWKTAQTEAELALQTEFNFRVQASTNKIEEQMLQYEKMLRGVQGLFAASGQVSRRKFRNYVNALEIERNYPGIQGLGFILLLPNEKKSQHIAEVRSEGFADYTIHTDGIRDFYTPVVYIEPLSGNNLLAFGYDNYADPLRRATLERVRDTGLCAITPKLKLVQEGDTGVQAGFLMMLPVYKQGAVLNTSAERHANLVGWVSASFRMDDLMASIFSRVNSLVDLEIYDRDEMSDQTLMHDQDTIRRDKGSSDSVFQIISQLQIAGHEWTLLFSSLPGFDERLNIQKSRLIVMSGITVSILLALLTGMLVFGRNRALLSAQELNYELTERKQAEVGMRLAETVFDAVDVAVLVTDANNRIVKVNPAFSVITGYAPEETIGHTTQMLSSGAHPPEFYHKMWATLKASGSWQGEISNRKKNGEFYTEWLDINEVRDSAGNVTNYVALFSDISERKAAEEHMHILAHYDSLTGLPNRTLLADRMQQAIAAAKREKSHMALLFIDLDKFKPINDALGHHIGDLMLKEVAKRILQCLRESDSAARIGGDEFIVLLPFIEVEADALAVAEKIRNTLNLSFEIEGRSLNISSSIGVAIYPEHGSDEKTLLKNADTAMYFAKEKGRNTVRVFELTMKKGVQ